MKKRARGRIACSLCLVQIEREGEEAKEIREGAEDEDQKAIEGKKSI